MMTQVLARLLAVVCLCSPVAYGEDFLKPGPASKDEDALTPVQRQFLGASRAERQRIMGDADARAELVKGSVKEIDGVFNFRDLGGKRGLGGRLVRPRLLYRSARFDEVTDEGCRRLTKDLHIRTDLDLRTPKEVARLNGRSPLGTNVTWKLVPLQAYADVASANGRKAMRKALKEVFASKNWPLAFHCKTGKDRTGTLAFVVLSLLGVDEETICLDWERTAFHVPELSRMDHPTRYDRMLDYFMSLPGTNLTAKTEGYVRSLGFSDAKINAFREALLAPPLRIRRVKLDVGAKAPFTFLHVSDSHLTGVDGRDGEDVHAFARARENLGRELGASYLEEAISYAHVNGLRIVHTGDVVEYASAASLSRAGEIIRENGILACVGNHEFWRTGKTREEEDKMVVRDAIRATFPGDQPAFSFETNGVSFLVFDNAFGRVSAAVTSAFERVVAKGLPVVLVCHVPFPSEELLGNRRVGARLMGEGQAKGDATAAAFVARVRGEPLVRAILCGHLHHFSITQFSPTSRMCVANALFNGEAVEVTLGASPAENRMARGASWLSVPSASVAGAAERKAKRAADGTSWFASTVTNAGEIVSATWTVAGLGVFEAYVNGCRVGDDFLKPGFTSADKTKYSFSYDVTKFLKTAKGEANVLAASVSSGWWRDQIAGFPGKKSAFRGELKVSFADGTSRTCGTDPDGWTCGIAGRVTHAGIFDGEEYDARKSDPVLGEGLSEKPEVNDEFRGELLPSAGAEICLREDLKIVRGPFAVRPGGPLVVDFGQNCAAVPRFRFKAKRGTVLTVLPGEMLNDADKGVRGSDGPKGSVYRANLRIPNTGMRLVYAFSGAGTEEYLPRFTFFGYRYLSITATDDVEIERIETVPVTSVAKSMELGRLETGDETLNKFISNVYWGQLSNYLSVPTDCPQRDERLGWSADTQVFAEAGSFNADTAAFFRKWMRDMRDSVNATGSFSGMAPTAQYGARYMRIGWSDAGVIVPYTVWRQFGDTRIVRENWAAMVRYVDHVAETRYDHWTLAKEAGWQYADWLSFENLESRSKRGLYRNGPDGKKALSPEAIAYWNYLGACYWRYDALLMAQMARGIGEGKAGSKYAAMAEDARSYLRKNFIDPSDGRLLQIFRSMQAPAVFALKFGLLDDERAIEETKKELRRNIAEHDGCLTTGFLGTSFIMDALSENGMSDVAYGLLLNHRFPSWLYSVDQGATTVWERWNSYTKKDGFGPVDMNSFNHYAYGAVLAWMYRVMAGIAADSEDPGFRTVVMEPKPDRRVGYVKAEYRSAAGLVKSAWRYEGAKWIWDFEVPEGAKAKVRLPGEASSRIYGPGRHHVEASAGTDR